MAVNDEHSFSKWKEIYQLTSRINQGALEAVHTPISRENLESMKRWTAAVMECLELLNDDEPTLVTFASLSCNDQSTPPSSPIALSPASSPRIALRGGIHQSVSFTDHSFDEDHRAFLPSIGQRPHAQPCAQPANQGSLLRPHIGVPSLITRREESSTSPRSSYFNELSTSSPSQASGNYCHLSPRPRDNAFTPYPRPTQHTHAMVAHSFDYALGSLQISSQFPPTHPISHLPRTGAPSSTIVITQPSATICEVPGFKRRGRPSTRVDNQCVECGTHRTPEWRRGEGGVHLCNACGLQYSKRVRREKAEKKRNAITTVLNHDSDV